MCTSMILWKISSGGSPHPLLSAQDSSWSLFGVTEDAFFYCLARWAYGAQGEHRRVRNELCNEMAECRDRYEAYVGDAEMAEVGAETYEEYVEKMRLDTTWGDLSVLLAATYVYRGRIKVLSPDPAQDVVMEEMIPEEDLASGFYTPDGEKLSLLVLGHEAEHYVLCVEAETAHLYDEDVALYEAYAEERRKLEARDARIVRGLARMGEGRSAFSSAARGNGGEEEGDSVPERRQETEEGGGSTVTSLERLVFYAAVDVGGTWPREAYVVTSLARDQGGKQKVLLGQHQAGCTASLGHLFAALAEEVKAKIPDAAERGVALLVLDVIGQGDTGSPEPAILGAAGRAGVTYTDVFTLARDAFTSLSPHMEVLLYFNTSFVPTACLARTHALVTLTS